ncbi:hypothetical protein HDU67_008985 [Dinochytrium kinnereticum]|nr:hypothetical protein HDU67_008985 [Dinochytrium kinnereticum]
MGGGRGSPSVISVTPALGTPSLNASASPNVSDANLLTDDDVIRALTGPNPPQTVKEIVAVLREKIAKDARNKDRIKEILKRLCVVQNSVISLRK